MDKYDPNYVPIYARFLLGVKVLVMNKDGKILLLKRSDKVNRSHGWDFPGGGVDKGEDPSDAAIREVKEETKLEVSEPRILSTQLTSTKGGDAIIMGYVAKLQKDDMPVLSWEHEDYRWITLDELKRIDLPKEHRAVMQAYYEIVD